MGPATDATGPIQLKSPFQTLTFAPSLKRWPHTADDSPDNHSHNTAESSSTRYSQLLTTTFVPFDHLSCPSEQVQRRNKLRSPNTVAFPEHRRPAP